MSSTKKISAMFILEVIGKPAEHLVEALEEIIKKIDEEKDVNVNGKKIKEPTPMKEQEGFFTTFAEVEVEAENMMLIAMLMFKYMPAHIEIISPENITLSNNEFGEILSELTRRLHGYDEVARVLQTERTILETKLRELMPKEDKKKEK